MTTTRKERSILKAYLDKLEVLEDPDAGVRENLLNMYRNRYPDAMEEEAEAVINGILSGIFDFNQGVSAYVQNGMEAVLDITERQLKDKNNREKYTTYCNITVAIKTMDQKVLSRLLGSEKFQAEAALENLFYSGVECGTNVTDEMVEEVQQMMISSLESSVILLIDIERLKDIPEDQAEEYIREFAAEEWSAEERKAYLALAAYLAYRDGKIYPETGEAAYAVNPYYWAVSIAAEVEAEKAVHDALRGNTTWQTAVMIIRSIGYIVFALVVCTVNTALLILVIELMCTTAGVLSFFVIGALGFGLLFALTCVEALIEDGVTDRCEFVKRYIEDNYERIQEGIENVYQYIKNKITAGYLFLSGNTGNDISTEPRIDAE